MTRVQTLRNRFNVLARFESADDVADFFRRKGIKGDNSFRHCPVANYLKVCGDSPTTDVLVGDGKVTAYIPGLVVGNGVYYEMDTTPAMKRFIALFDHGTYKDLWRDSE